MQISQVRELAAALWMIEAPILSPHDAHLALQGLNRSAAFLKGIKQALLPLCGFNVGKDLHAKEHVHHAWLDMAAEHDWRAARQGHLNAGNSKMAVYERVVPVQH